MPSYHGLRRLHRAVAVIGQLGLEVAEPFAIESATHFAQEFDALALKAEHVALVQPTVAGLARVGLAQDATHELGQRARRAGASEDRQHVGEGAVPALLQRLLGDDEPDLAVARQQAAGVIHLLEVIASAGLHRDLLGTDVGVLHQVLTRILGVHDAGQPLIAAGALHLDQVWRDNQADWGCACRWRLLQDVSTDDTVIRLDPLSEEDIKSTVAAPCKRRRTRPMPEMMCGARRREDL